MKIIRKQSQSFDSFFSWYNLEVASDENTSPEILTKILKKENSDNISYHAAYNPNCPPEMLTEILRRGKNDLVSQFAAKNPNCPIGMLKEILKRDKNDSVSCQVLENPNCTIEMVQDVLNRKINDRISFHAATSPNCPKKAKIQWMIAVGKITKEDPQKHKIEYDEKLVDDTDFNTFRGLVSSNNHLRKISQSEEDKASWYNEDVAWSNDTSPEILAKILRMNNSDIVSWPAAFNLNCPPDILAEVLRRGENNFVSQSAADNPNCPSEILAEVLKRRKNDSVSLNASKNPNCPARARIQWMMDLGKITEEDPEKHKIEYDEKHIDDTDFESFKELVSNNNSWYKISQSSEDKASWYNETVAKDLNTSTEILTKILRTGNDDSVTRLAALHPNCSPEILTEILRRNDDSTVSQFAARHLNCPPEILTEVLKRNNNSWTSQIASSNPNCSSEILVEILKRGNDNDVSWTAVQNVNCPSKTLAEIVRDNTYHYDIRCAAVENPNCPSEVLEEVLSKGEKNNISLNASQNPNCPAKAKIKWLIDTNQITNEDPEKHQIEYDEKPIDDTDFNTFRDLVKD